MSTRMDVIDKLWLGSDPCRGFPSKIYQVDHQGWNSHHRYLARAVDEAKPKLIVEIGVWKGGSALTLAGRARELGLDAVVIAIDTWLGSSENWNDTTMRAELGMEGGYPKLYHKFMANVFDRGLQDYVVPLPLDSVNAYEVLRHHGLRPDVLHIDGGHDFRSATNDLTVWWPFLNSGGVLVGDDYFDDGSIWPEVKRAFDTFFATNRPALFESGDAKCYVRKPG